MERVDVVIVGGGPAGMSAALVLGRCGRRVLLFDHGRYRNRASRKLHGFLTRDGIAPEEFRRVAREQLMPYPSVRVRDIEVLSARRTDAGFEVTAAGGLVVASRALLLATGIEDLVPDIPGLEELLGVRAFHCPYCDGWEHRNQPLFAYGHGDEGAKFALELTLWSPDVALCTDGRPGPERPLQQRLQRAGIMVHEARITRVDSHADQIRCHFADHPPLSRSALFYSVGCRQASSLARELRVAMDGRESVDASRREETNVPNLFVAGDASRDALQAVVAAGEGSNAALAINKSLMAEDLW